MTPEERADLKAILDLSDADLIVIERRIIAAIRDERERCAQIAEETNWRLVTQKTLDGVTRAIAAAIRTTTEGE